MELEEIVSRLEHLDGERRNQKTAFASLEKRFKALEDSISGLLDGTKELGSQVSQLQSMTDRFAQVDASLKNFRENLNRSLEKNEKQAIAREKNMEKIRLADMETVNKALAENKKAISPLKTLKSELKERSDGEKLLSNRIDELKPRIESAIQQNEEIQQSFKILEETRKTESKRIADIQGETAAIRKRTEEQRGKIDFLAESIQKLNARFDENQANEVERKQALLSLIERENLSQVERDHEWKDWQARFSTIDEESRKFETKMMNLDVTIKELKKSQSAFEEINQRFDRKINELIEMQRITDERFRQEWLGFKAEDQKRWTSYSLNQNEIVQDANHDLETASTRISKLEEITGEIRDAMISMNEETQKRLQVLLDLTNDWMDANQRLMGNGK